MKSSICNNFRIPSVYSGGSAQHPPSLRAVQCWAALLGRSPSRYRCCAGVVTTADSVHSRIRQGPAQVQQVLLNLQRHLEEERLLMALKASRPHRPCTYPTVMCRCWCSSAPQLVCSCSEAGLLPATAWRLSMGVGR